MPTVEDYFDDDTDIPLPSASGSGSASASGSGAGAASSSSRPRGLQGQGLQGALLEEISTDDPEDFALDYERIADQGRGIFGENSHAPPPGPGGEGKGKVAVRGGDNELRPSGAGGPGQPGGGNTPMGGFMGDMMKMQQLEEERLEKLRKQFGNTTIASDPSVYKEWNSLYPLYFDSKVSASKGRRVPREKGLWWPQAQHISVACRNLGLQSCLEPNRTHPADFENPGRVKVLFKKDGKYLNPTITNRTQLYVKLAEQMGREQPTLAYLSNPPKKRSRPTATTATDDTKSTTTTGSSKKSKKTLAQGKGKSTTTATASKPAKKRTKTMPPLPPQPVLSLEQRLPLHSPLVATGIAVSSIKRDLETERENKKKGLTAGSGAGGGGGGEEGSAEKGAGGKDKQPKMKRMVVRGKR